MRHVKATITFHGEFNDNATAEDANEIFDQVVDLVNVEHDSAGFPVHADKNYICEQVDQDDIEIENVIGDAVDAWEYLCEHRIFQKTYEGYSFSVFKTKCLDIAYVRVNPWTNAIDDDNSLNTKMQVWLECGEYIQEENNGMHDIDLDCGGDTFEEAIVILANKVSAKYDH